MTRYRRDNAEFRAHIARRARKLSIWQTVILGLVVNLFKLYAVIGRAIARD